MEKNSEADQAAQLKKKKAVAAWSSRQRPSRSCAPLVRWLRRVYAYRGNQQGLREVNAPLQTRGDTYVVAAGMSTQLGGRSDGSAEEEENVQRVKEKWEKSVALEGVAPGGWDQVEQGQHGEGSHKDVVVDERRVAGKGHGNDVTNEGHGDEGEEELYAQVSS